MTAAELLRRLDKAATAGPWLHTTDYGQIGHVECANGEPVAQAQQREPRDHNQRNANAKCIATTRNLLPLLAGLVEALGDFMDPEKEDDVDANYQRVERSYAALNAAAAKEGK